MIYYILISSGCLMAGFVIGYRYGKKVNTTIQKALDAKNAAIMQKDAYEMRVEQVMEHLANRTYPCNICGREFHNYYNVIKGDDLYPENGVCSECKKHQA